MSQQIQRFGFCAMCPGRAASGHTLAQAVMKRWRKFAPSVRIVGILENCGERLEKRRSDRSLPVVFDGLSPRGGEPGYESDQC